MSNLRVRINKDYIGNISFAIFSTGHTVNEQWIFGRPTRRVLEEGAIVLEPSFQIDWGNANEFMLALKEAIRIYEGSTPDFSQGELKATKYHLEDLRRLLKIV
jgi:hypothetical protein